MDEAAVAQPPPASLQKRRARLWRFHHDLGSCVRHHVRPQKRKRRQNESAGTDVPEKASVVNGMGQKKLIRFAELNTFPNVLQYPPGMAGRWHEPFKNTNPIT